MKRRPKPSKRYICSLLSYDSRTGFLFWKESRGRISKGYRAGTEVISHGKKYIYVKIDKRFYKAHQIAWMLFFGKWPSSDIDHIDGDGKNNRIKNLRECTMSQNKANSKLYKNNKLGIKGVCFDRGYFRASIQFNHKKKYLGKFNSSIEASMAYQKAAKKLFGEFARAT